MNAPIDGPDPEEDLSPVERVWAQVTEEISRDHPGWAVVHDVQGFWARRDGDEVGPVSCEAALRSLIGMPRPRKATP